MAFLSQEEAAGQALFLGGAETSCAGHSVPTTDPPSTVETGADRTGGDDVGDNLEVGTATVYSRATHTRNIRNEWDSESSWMGCTAGICGKAPW